MTCRCKY